MMRILALAVVVPALVSQPAAASQTACVISSDKAPHYYELEFIGYSDRDPMIVFSSTAFGSGKRFPLRSADYTLKQFNQQAGSVSLEFRNPNDPALPPSFNLTGISSGARLTIGPDTIRGVLACNF
jgi:hypothetical protein